MTTSDRVKDVIATQLNVRPDQATEDASFIQDLGADSLDQVELIMELENTFAIEVPNEDAEKIITVGDAIRYVEKKVGLTDENTK